MNKAVILTLYAHPEQANILIKQLLKDEETDIFIHIDKKEEDKVLPYLLKNERVIINTNNIVVHWGADEHLKAILSTYRLILSQEKKYEYVLMCSGSDLLVKPDLDGFLCRHKGEIFIDCFNENPDEKDKQRRTFLLHKWPKVYLNVYDNKYHPARIARRLRIILFNRFPNILKKKVEYNTDSIRFYHSLAWQAFPIEMVKFIIDFLDTNKTFFDIYDGELVAEEGFFATMVMMSPYKDKLNFTDGRSRSLTFAKVCVNNRTPILTTKDIPIIDNDEMAYFARKFDLNTDKDVIEYYMKKTGVFDTTSD